MCSLYQEDVYFCCCTIPGARAPMNQGQLKQLLSDVSEAILVISKAYYLSNLILVFLTDLHYFSYQVATQLSSRGWVHPVPVPIHPGKYFSYSRETNPESL